MILDIKELRKFEEFKNESDIFTEKLMNTPIHKNINVSNGMNEALFQLMMSNPALKESFEAIIEKYKIKQEIVK